MSKTSTSDQTQALIDSFDRIANTKLHRDNKQHGQITTSSFEQDESCERMNRQRANTSTIYDTQYLHNKEVV